MTHRFPDKVCRIFRLELHTLLLYSQGLRLGDDEYKQFGEAGKKIIKEVYRLRKSPEGVQPPLMCVLT